MLILTQIQLYKETILKIIGFLFLLSIFLFGKKCGADSVNKKWNEEKIELQKEEINKQNKIIELQKLLKENAEKQILIDKENAEKTAKERESLIQQQKNLQNTINNLIKKNDVYKNCVLDSETLNILNKSLKG